MSASNYFQSNIENSKRLEFVLKIYVGIIALSILADFLLIITLDRTLSTFDYYNQPLTFNDTLVTLVGLLQVIGFIVASIYFLIWFYRAYSNLHCLRPSEATRSKGATIWGFIVPIVSLFFPYQIATEIWNGNQAYIKSKKLDFGVNSKVTFIGWWWAFFLVSNFIGNIIFKVAFDEINPFNSAIVYLISDVIDFVGIYFTIRMIERMAEIEKQVESVVSIE